MIQHINGKYIGYVRMSDATQNRVFASPQTVDITLDDSANPFIVEGELYDAGKGESLTIRYADGHYFVQTFHVSPEKMRDTIHVTRKEYLPSRMPGVGKLVYLQFWDEVSDPFCEGMTTLQPGNLVFVGFKAEEN